MRAAVTLRDTVAGQMVLQAGWAQWGRLGGAATEWKATGIWSAASVLCGSLDVVLSPADLVAEAVRIVEANVRKATWPAPA